MHLATVINQFYLIMKKNLRFVLALTLGLATTVSAQDWSVDSRTRVNSTEDATSTTQRVRTAVDFGGDAVSAHVEFNAWTTLGNGGLFQEFGDFDVRQAHATTDLMGFASLTAGRMAVNFGSGRILGDNDWSNDINTDNSNTFDGLLFGINNDFADIHLGYAATDMTANDVLAYDASKMFVNIAKEMDAMSFNLLYMTTKNESDDAAAEMDVTTMGLDATYAMDNGVNLSLGYYTNDDGTTEMDLTTLGASYEVNGDLSVHAGYDMYGENGFYLSSGSFGDNLGSGMKYSAFDATRGECTDMSFGGSYAMGNFMIGATMHTISPEEEGAFEDISVMDLSVGYTLTDNSSVTLNYATYDDGVSEEETTSWISLNIGF